MLSGMGRFMKEFRQVIAAPVLVVGVAALILYVLGMLPAHMPGYAPAVKEYASIEQAASELGFNIVEPVYFPSYLSWPAARIRGQQQPFPMVEMSFLASDRRTEILLIYQLISDRQDLPIPLPWIEIVDQEMPITINDSRGELIVGRRAGGDVVNGAHWKVNSQHFLIVTTQPVQELLALARSIYP